MRKLLTISLAVLATLFTLAPATASASLFGDSVNQACSGAQASESGSCDSTAADSVNKTLKTAINIFSVIVGIITVVMFIISGFRFITSSGDPGKVNSARQGLIYAIVGLIIVLMSQVLIRYVFVRVTKSKNPPVCDPKDSNGHCTGCPDTSPADGTCDNASLRRPPSVAELYKIEGINRKLLGNFVG